MHGCQSDQGTDTETSENVENEGSVGLEQHVRNYFLNKRKNKNKNKNNQNQI